MGSRGLQRRGLLGRLFGRRPSERVFFALQLVLHADGDEGLRDRLHDILAGEGPTTPDDKRRYYRRLCAALLAAEPYYEYACFAYERDEERAGPLFDEWVSEIEASMATEEEETADAVDGYHRLDAEKRYIVVTLLFLLAGEHPAAAAFDPDDEDTYTREHMGELVDSIHLLDFEEGVEADATFLVPGSREDGFSWSDLASEGWEHLMLLRSAA